MLARINAAPRIKRVIIDTVNAIMLNKEMYEMAKNRDQWMDLARDLYSLVLFANSMRDDLVVYLFGHTVVSDGPNGLPYRKLVTNGRKLEKIELETKVTFTLMTRVDLGENGENKYFFETQKNNSSAKTPIGLFDSFLIPNSLKLIDEKIREYYNIK
jgi:hypothetical protein